MKVNYTDKSWNKTQQTEAWEETFLKTHGLLSTKVLPVLQYL